MTEAPPSTHRLFFALWPSEAQQRMIAQSTRVAIDAAGGRPVPHENFHLTLAFLGSVAEDALPRVRAVAEEVSNAVRTNGPPIEITLDQFDYWRKPQILCTTASNDPLAAIALAEHLKRELIEVGFAPDLKAFRAHVTLARKVRRAPATQLCAPRIALSFRDFSLVDSRSESGRSIYSVDASWPLWAC